MAHGKWSEVEARSVLEAWRRSGLPLERFAKQRGFVPQRLRWWRSRIARSEQAVSLAPLPALLPVRVSPDSQRRGECNAPGFLDTKLRYAAAGSLAAARASRGVLKPSFASLQARL